MLVVESFKKPILAMVPFDLGIETLDFHDCTYVWFCSRRLEVGRNSNELLVASIQALVDQLPENEWGLLLRLHFDAQVSKRIKFCVYGECNVKKRVEILPGGGRLFIRPHGLGLWTLAFPGISV